LLPKQASIKQLLYIFFLQIFSADDVGRRLHSNSPAAKTKELLQHKEKQRLFLVSTKKIAYKLSSNEGHKINEAAHVILN
jgi:hypothetical protein